MVFLTNCWDDTRKVTMSNLRDIIEANNKQPSKKEEQVKIQKQVVRIKDEIVYPELYTNKKLLDLAYKINDQFISNLKVESEITKEKLEDALPEYIISFQEVRILKKETVEDIKKFIINNIIGYGPISTIFEIAQHGLNDVIVNTKDYIDIIYNGKTHTTPFIFRSEGELRTAIDKMLAENNRKIDEANPIASSKLNDGSRVEAQIPPIAANGGSCLTIRKFNETPMLLENLIDSGFLDFKMAYFLIKAAKGKANIIVSGGTSSGKTTFLNAISRFIDDAEQVITIEDTRELQPQLPCHSIRPYESRNPNQEGKGEISLEYLLRSALRSSPRRIIVGECRGPEIVVMLNAMNTGHPGSMTTIHADGMKEALVRIENMYLEARPSANIDFIRSQIVSAVDILVQLVRFPDGRRKVIAISELEKRMESGGVIALNNIFEFKRDLSEPKIINGNFDVMSVPTRTIDQMNMYGVDIDKKVFDPSFELSKDMLTEELQKDLPNKMCGWKSEYLSIFEAKEPLILNKWPHIGIKK